MTDYSYMDFNPRSPHGERRGTRFKPESTVPISIHAPRTGSDPDIDTVLATQPDFNPRSPHGERRYPGCSLEVSHDFNPRSPHGERQIINHLLQDVKRYFNPRSPHGERRPILLSAGLHRGISIHAPRTGSDLQIRRNCVPLVISIHAPRTGSDGDEYDAQAQKDISIHAPRTGSDRCSYHSFRHARKFQSTLPARGATVSLLSP